MTLGLGLQHLAIPVRTQTWQLGGTTAWTDDATPATVEAVQASFSTATAWDHEDTPTGPGPHKGLLGSS